MNPLAEDSLETSILISLINNVKIFMNAVCCSHDCRFKGQLVLPGKQTVKFLGQGGFWHYSVSYHVSITKIICISILHQLNEIQFSCIFLNKSYQKTTEHALWELASHSYKVNRHISGTRKYRSQ